VSAIGRLYGRNARREKLKWRYMLFS
jgi:hypothetical protein